MLCDPATGSLCFVASILVHARKDVVLLRESLSFSIAGAQVGKWIHVAGLLFDRYELHST